MSLLTALAVDLDNRGHGIYKPDASFDNEEWGISVEALLIHPSQLIVITGYGGAESSSGMNYDMPRIQVRVRGGLDTTVSRSKCQSIYNEWHGLSHLTVDGEDIQLIIGLNSGPVYFGPDGNGRHQHVTNFEVTVKNPNRVGRSS